VTIHAFAELMVVVYQSITIEGLNSVRAAQRRLHEQYGSIAGLSILKSEALSRPEAAVRTVGQAISDEFDTMAYASAIVLVEQGMGGALYRSILTGIHLASRRPVPQKVFASPDLAIAWIVGKNPQGSLAPRMTELQRRVGQIARGESTAMGPRGRT
jgi:hypothetical protein